MDVIRRRITSVSIGASALSLGPDKQPQTDKHLKQENQTDKNKLRSHEKCFGLSSFCACGFVFKDAGWN